MPQHGSVANNRGVLVNPPKEVVNEFEIRARQAVQKKAVETISDIGQPANAHVRQLLPEEDLETTDDNDWSDDDRQWEQTGLTADEMNNTYSFDADDRKRNKVVAIFAVTNISGSPSTTQIQFETGNGAIIERANVEGLLTDPEDTLLFADPLIYSADENGEIQQYVTDTEDNVVLHGVVAEKAGRTLEESDRFLTHQ